MPGKLFPLSADPEAARTLAGGAARARAARWGSALDPDQLARETEDRVRSGTFPGRLWKPDGRFTGIALWEPPEPLGASVRFCHLAERDASADRYREFLAALLRDAGPIAFVAPIGGLDPQEESRVLTSLGLRPFHRSEMRWPPAAPVPRVDPPAGATIRPVRAQDEPSIAAVHAAAYRDHFDRFLFFEDPDPARDAERVVRSLFEGRWSEPLLGPSRLAELRGRAIGSIVVVRHEGRALIADVAVEREWQGRGVAAALLGATVGALVERGERVIALAVTEENRRAVRLYERFGFVRCFGPERRWYNPDRVPVAAESG